MSIPTLLRSKPLVGNNNMQSLSYASLSSTSSSSSNRLNDAEVDLTQQPQKQVSNKSQLRFVQPKKQNQLLNLNKQENPTLPSSTTTNRSAKKSPVLRQANEHSTTSDTTKSDRLSADSNNNNIITNASNESIKKDSQLLVNNSGGSTNSINKRRLFSPYSLNINNNTESVSSASLTNSITGTNVASSIGNRKDLENQQISPQKQQAQTTYKLFSHLNGFKAANNTNQNSDNNKMKYFSKMQVKATHLKSTGMANSYSFKV